MGDGETVTLRVDVTNTGARLGMRSCRCTQRGTRRYPLRYLVGFQRVTLDVGETKRVEFGISAAPLTRVTNTGERVLEPGVWTLFVGGGQPGHAEVVTATVEV